MKSFGFVCAVASLVGVLALSGCSGSSGSSGGSKQITVTITSPTSSPTIQAGQTVNITASVANDSSNSGVTWSVSGGGTLSSQTSTSVTYNAPATVSANTTVTVTATSAASASATATLTITVTPTPAISVTISNPITSITAGSAAVTLNAAVQNDSTNSGVTWTLTAGGAACSPTCGALSGATSTSVTYTPPATVPASPNDAPTITATSVANTSASATDSFTISAPVVQAITVSITNPITTITAGAAAVTLNASIQNDSSNSGVTWTLTAGGNACSPTCGSLSGATATSVSYAPPANVPASPNNAPTITATSVADTTKSASDAFTITSSTSTNNDALLKGQYAFLVAGYDTAMTASVTTDGQGNITGGEEDYIALTPALTSGDENIKITSGTYTVGADDRGTITFTDTAKNSFTFAIAVGTITNGVATHGQMIEFDTNPLEMTGELALQNSSAFSTSAFTGGYAFGFPGWDSNVNPSITIGSFTVSAGSISNGLYDANDGGSISTSVSFTGSLSTADANGRFTLTLMTGGNTAPPVPCYAVSPGDWLCAAYEGGLAISYGTIVQQTGGPYAVASLNGNMIYEDQSVTGVPSPHEMLGILTSQGTGSASGSFDVDDGGGATKTTTGTATYSVTSAANGRVLLNPSGGSPIVFYMIGPNRAFTMDESSKTGFGTVEAQEAGPFTNSSLKGTYFFGTLPLVSPPAGPGPGMTSPPPLNYFSGIATADGAGNTSIVLDGNSSGSLASGNSNTDTYTVGSNGRVTFGTSTSILYIVSPNKFYLMTVPSGTTANPTISVGKQ